MYRGANNKISFKQCSSIFLALESPKFKSVIQMAREKEPNRRLIFGLPLELNPNSIEHCLATMHGIPAKLPVDDQQAHLEKLFIAGAYLGLNNLMHQVRVFATKKFYQMDYPEMDAFICTLPKVPNILTDFPKDISFLPSITKVSQVNGAIEQVGGPALVPLVPGAVAPGVVPPGLGLPLVPGAPGLLPNLLPPANPMPL